MPDQWDAVAAAMRAAVADTVAALGPKPAAPAPAAPGVDLARWKLTIPELGADGKIREIKPPALATYSSRYFERLPDGALRFRCWHGGATTKRSSNPRSELRERVGDDPEGYWPLRSGRHVLEVVGQINRNTKVKPHVVASQIHAKSEKYDDVTVWRIEGPKLWITRGNTTHGHLVDDALPYGKPYTLRTEVADGKIRFAYNGRTVPFELDAPDDDAYFKAGLYLNSNPETAPGESTEEYAEVVVYNAKVSHS